MVLSRESRAVTWRDRRGRLGAALHAVQVPVVAPQVGDVGALAPGESGFPDVAEPLAGRQLHLAADPQRLVVFAPPPREALRETIVVIAYRFGATNIATIRITTGGPVAGKT